MDNPATFIYAFPIHTIRQWRTGHSHIFGKEIDKYFETWICWGYWYQKYAIIVLKVLYYLLSIPQVYTACLELVPHKKFTFAKVWIMYAHFEIRQKNLTKARKILVSKQTSLEAKSLPLQEIAKVLKIPTVAIEGHY